MTAVLVDADPQGHPLTPPPVPPAELGRLSRETGRDVVVCVYSDGRPALYTPNIGDALTYVRVVRDAGQIVEVLDIRFELDRRATNRDRGDNER